MTLLPTFLSVLLGAASAAEIGEDAYYRQPLNASLYSELDSLWHRRHEAGAEEEHLAKLRRGRQTAPFDVQLLWRYGRAMVLRAEASDIWRRRRIYADAVEALETALDIEPSCVEAKYWKVRALLQREPRSDEVARLFSTLSQLGR